MANDFLITDVVDKEAFGQLERLRTDMNSTVEVYVKMAETMAARSKDMPNNFEQLGEKAQGYVKILGDMNSTQTKLIKIQEKQLQVLREVSGQLENLQVLGKLDKLFTQTAKSVEKVNSKMAEMGKNASQGASGMQGAAKTAEEVSVQLKKVELNFDEISKTVRDYNDDIMKLNQAQIQIRIEMNTLKDIQRNLDKEYDKGKISIQQYTQESAKLKNSQEKLNAQYKQNAALIRNHATAVVSTKGSYYELNATMLELQKRFYALDEAGRDSDLGKNLIKQANDINNKLKQIDAQFGNYRRNVGNYASSWNGLGMSIQQVGRELPSLAMGWNTFFLAISNNLPILTDELARAKKEYKELTAAGETAVPVWKQVVKGIFSWQTALIVGVTVLSMYGKDIVNWIKGLFKAEDAMKDLVDVQKELNAVQAKGAQNAQDEIIHLNLLYKATQDAKRPVEERKKAVDELQKVYPEYFENLTDEEVLAGKASDAYTRLSTSIVAAARARAAQDKMVENAKVILENEEKINEAYSERDKLEVELQNALKQRELVYSQGLNELYMDVNIAVRSAATGLEDIDEQIAEYRKTIYETNKLRQELANNINIGDLLFGDGKAGDDDSKKKAEEYKKYLEEIGKELSESQIALMEEGRAKERAEIEAAYREKMEKITGQTKDEIALRKNLEELKEKELEEVDRKWEEKRAEAELSAMKTRLSAMGASTQEELNQRLRMELEVNELMRQAEVRAAEQKGEDVIAIEEKYMKMRNDIIVKNLGQRVKLIEQSTDEELRAQEVAALQEMNALKQQYASGEIDREAYEKGQYDVAAKYSKMRLEALMKEAEMQLSIGGLTEAQQKELGDRLDNLKAQLESIGLDEEVDKNKEKLDEFNEAVMQMEGVANDALGGTGKLFEGLGSLIRDFADDGKISMDNLVQSIGSVMAGLSSLMGDIYDAKIEKLEEEQEANEEAYDAEIERIEKLEEQGAISTEEAEARKRAAEDRTKQKEEEIAKKKAALQQKQANWDKANSIIQATIATGLAVTKALPNLVLAALVGAMGAAQIALIAAQPVPKYAKGTKDHPGGLAVVGDGGRSEAVVTERGVFATPDRPTLVDLPRHAQVIPDIRMLTDKKGLTSDYRLLEEVMRGKKGDGVTVNVEGGDYSGLEKKLGENTRELKDIRKIMRKDSRRRERERMKRVVS